MDIHGKPALMVNWQPDVSKRSRGEGIVAWLEKLRAFLIFVNEVGEGRKRTSMGYSIVLGKTLKAVKKKCQLHCNVSENWLELYKDQF